MGPAVAAERAATVAFVPQSVEPIEVVTRLTARGFMAGYGNFYAVRLLNALHVDPERGAVRVSLVHYNSAAEVAALIDALDGILSR